MENATKALLMAGAILITIILIGAGLLIINSTKGMDEQVGKTSESMAKATFNAQFTSYIGTNITQANVRALLSRAIASNSQNSRQVLIKSGENLLSPEEVINNINKAFYTVVANYEDGYITSIEII